jgi:hypothetical protein
VRAIRAGATFALDYYDASYSEEVTSLELASIGSALLPLALLACPIGMGLMMWFMARGMGGDKTEARQTEPGEVERLRAEQERLAAEVERLERERSGEREPAAS